MFLSGDYVSFNAADVTSVARTARASRAGLLLHQANQLGAKNKQIERLSRTRQAGGPVVRLTLSCPHRLHSVYRNPDRLQAIVESAATDLAVPDEHVVHVDNLSVSCLHDDTIAGFQLPGQGVFIHLHGCHGRAGGKGE